MRLLKNRQLTLILAVYTLLALGYGALNPVFEAPDEQWHYFTAQTIAETGRLPSVGTEPDPWMAQEAAQPPLYYTLASLLIRPVDTGQAREQVWANPRVQLGDASAPQNINAFVHGPWEAWPWQGYALAVHLVRALSSLFGLGTLLCIFGAARLIWPEKPGRATLATALVAFLPQYAFLHGSVTNDTLIIFLSSAVLWQLLWIWFRGAGRNRLSILGLTLGLAILTKTAGLLLLLYALGLLSLLVWREGPGEGSIVDRASTVLKDGLRTLAPVLGPALLIGGWLLWRNWQLYGDITAAGPIIEIFGGDRSYTLGQVLGESSGLWASMFAVFGWFNVRPPGWVHLIWNGFVLVALAGLILGIFRSKLHKTEGGTEAIEKPVDTAQTVSWIEHRHLPSALLALWALLVYVALLRFMLQIHAGQGRLLFPALLPMALALAGGLDRFRWKGVRILAPVLALFTSLYSLFLVIPGAYSRPPALDATDIPAGLHRFDVDLGQGLKLIASQVETETTLPGEWIWLTLYWEAETVPVRAGSLDAPQVVIDVLAFGDNVAGKSQSYHGGGLYPASLWERGQIVADRLAVRTVDYLQSPIQVRLNLKLAGEDSSLDVGTVKVRPEEWPAMEKESLAQLEGLAIIRADLGATLVQQDHSVSLVVGWQVNSPPGRALTTFVHLGDLEHPPLAQGDSIPLRGTYPTTLWEAGEVFSDSYDLDIPYDLPPGRYPVHMGMYDPATGVRVPLMIDGLRQPNDAYHIDWLTVQAQ